MVFEQGKSISIIGVPLDLGADRRGVDMGPSAIRCAGVGQRLKQLGFSVRDEGDITVRSSKSTSVNTKNLKHLQEISRVNEDLHLKVASAVAAGRFPLVLGGDHSVAIGTLAGLSRQINALGLIWFDAHGDANRAETSPSGNIHGMSLAVALGHGHPLLTAIGGKESKVRPEHTVIIGTRSLDPGERIFLKRVGITVFSIRDIERIGMAKVVERSIEIASQGTDGIHLSFDLDGLDPREAPGVGTPVPGGVSLRESLLMMEILSDTGKLMGAEFVEVNPALDYMNQTAKVTVDLISVLFGEKII